MLASSHLPEQPLAEVVAAAVAAVETNPTRARPT
jgi:hypothetical protein